MEKVYSNHALMTSRGQVISHGHSIYRNLSTDTKIIRKHTFLEEFPPTEKKFNWLSEAIINSSNEERSISRYYATGLSAFCVRFKEIHVIHHLWKETDAQHLKLLE